MKSSTKRQMSTSKTLNSNKANHSKINGGKRELPGASTNLSRFSSSIYLKELEQQSLKSSNVFIGEYQLLNIIGRGAHSNVLLVRSELSKQTYAMKLMTIANEELGDIVREKLILQKVSSGDCGFIARVHDFILTSGHVGFLMDYLPSITLSNQIALVKNFTNEKIIFYTACIVLALEYLHKINVFHRDIALRNMIVDESGYLKIIDFGLAIDNSEKFKTSTRLNEMLDFEDMARCVWEMLTGEAIHSVPNYPRKFGQTSALVYKFVRMIFPEGETSKLYESKVAIDEIKLHGMFRNINWIEMKEKKVKPPFNVKILPPINEVRPVWQNVASWDETSVSHMLKKEFRNVIPWRSGM